MNYKPDVPALVQIVHWKYQNQAWTLSQQDHLSIILSQLMPDNLLFNGRHPAVKGLTIMVIQLDLNI